MTLFVRSLAAALVAVAAAACTTVPFLGEDCGCSAFYEIPESGEIHIQFREVLAETVGGHTNCGFKDVPIKVRSARIGGLELREIKKEDGGYLYAAPPDFDPKKDVVTIEAKGTTFVSRTDSVRQSDKRIWFDLKH